jgi:hypothetical protein
MFETLLGIIPLTADAFQWLLRRSEKERENFASLCDRIAVVLETFVKASDDQRSSRNLCRELLVYVPEIEEIANPILEGNQLNEMAKALSEVCSAWSRHSASVGQEAYVSKSDLDEINAAAGHFRGLANLVRKK